jgi:hypothetical protein
VTCLAAGQLIVDLKLKVEMGRETEPKAVAFGSRLSSAQTTKSLSLFGGKVAISRVFFCELRCRILGFDASIDFRGGKPPSQASS